MDWNRLDPLLEPLLDLTEAERAARPDELAREHPEDAARLRGLLDPERGEPGLERFEIGACPSFSEWVPVPVFCGYTRFRTSRWTGTGSTRSSNRCST